MIKNSEPGRVRSDFHSLWYTTSEQLATSGRLCRLLLDGAPMTQVKEVGFNKVLQEMLWRTTRYAHVHQLQ